MDYSFFLFFNGSEKYLQFKKLQKHLVEKIFGSPHTSNRIYLPWNYFTNYVYLKDMCITFKEIGKILFVSILRILYIPHFTAFFKKRFQIYNFSLDKLTSV